MADSALSESSLDLILEKMYKARGWDFRRYRRASLKRCIERRVNLSRLPPGNYAELLDDHPVEFDHLFGQVTIKVSEFFRDREVFDSIRKKVIPAALDRAASSGNNLLRIWSCGCARGEEAYSMAMLIYLAGQDDPTLPGLSLFSDDEDDLKDGLSVKIFATDIDEQAIDMARKGIYHGHSLKSTDPDLIAAFFGPAKRENHHQVNPDIRSIITFGVHDIGSHIQLSHMDIILCRNLLIYFEKDLQEKVFDKFWYSLNKGGFLILGRSEVVPPKYRERFRDISRKEKIYQKV